MMIVGGVEEAVVGGSVVVGPVMVGVDLDLDAVEVVVEVSVEEVVVVLVVGQVMVEGLELGEEWVVELEEVV